MPKQRPVDAPSDFDWTSAYGEYVRGTQAIAEREDALGCTHLEAALKKDRHFAPAYSALAAFEMRRGDTVRVHALCEKALAINAYDALANYVDGYAYFVEGDQVTARERLAAAQQQPQYRSPALTLIARGYLREGDPAKAIVAAKKALQSNDLNLEAILSVALAMRDETAKARRAFLSKSLARLPLCHALRYELALAGGEADYARYIRNELSSETYLELGSWYAETGFEEDARRFFERAGDNLVAKVRLGDWVAVKRLPITGAFPFRRETLPMLARAVAEDGHWKFRYLLAVLKAFFGYGDEANALLDGCGETPDEPVFYQYRAMRRTGERRLADLRRAQELGDGWRVGRQLVAHYEETGDYGKVLETATEYLTRYPGKNPLQIARGRALLKLKRYRECLDYLETVDLLPSEHGGSATDIWQEAQKALGLPPTWPENLGKGEPYPDRKRKKQETSN